MAKKKAKLKAAPKSGSEETSTGLKKSRSAKAASRSAVKKAGTTASKKATSKARSARQAAGGSTKATPQVKKEATGRRAAAKAGSNKRATVQRRKTTVKRAAKKKAAQAGKAKKAASRKATAKPAEKKKPAKSRSPKRSRASVAPADLIAQPSPLPRFPVVGIGASAGGLQALEEFFQHLPADTGMAFVLVSHLDPDHASILHELLRKSSALPIQQITDGVALEMDHVYVGPPGKDVAILNGALQLMKPTKPHGVRLPIDYWFRSLAQDQQEGAIGIILSGNGSDGTLGVKAIKGESGMVMAQDPDSAKFTGMPCSAIATGQVDFVLAAEKMPEQLLRCTRGPYVKEPEPDLGIAVPVPAAMQKIFVLLRGRTGHDFSLYKSTTLRRRIARRMNIHQIKGHKHYIRYLEENPQEIDLLFKELLIGVTNFFRDREAFEALGKNALPDLLGSKPDDAALRVWVPGCSTGEEAYSVAMLLRETMNRLKRHNDIQIFATDLDAQAIEIARIGRYPDGIGVDVGPERLKRFFTRENDHYRIKKEIRETVIFAEQNLIKDPPFTKLDLLSCRNLLIYLHADLQKRLLPLFHYALKPDGILFLGPSETIGGFSELFKVVDKKWKVFARKAGATAVHAATDLPKPPAAGEDVEAVGPLPAAREKHPSVAELSSKLLSERYAPPSVIVNERGDIIYIHGQTGAYLRPAPGQPSHNVLAMAREGLPLEMAAALRKASRSDEEVVHKAVQVKANGGSVRVDLKVNKITNPETMRGLLMITFAPASGLAPAVSTEPPKRRTAKKKGAKRESALERELQYTKESLQSTIEALQTSNEELTSTNEELQSTNEEMQSTNEELETSKEEMQSLNEELQTVNSELQGKIDELSHANDDMTNLLNATDIATIFLSNDLRIKRFTHQASEVIRLIPSDVGRCLADIVSRLDYQDLEADAREVLKTLTFKELEVKSDEGVCYQMRIMPYRTSENVIDGLVVTFVNVTELKGAQAQAQVQAHARAQMAAVYEDIVNTVRGPLLALDEDFRIRMANRSFLRVFRASREETLGRLLWELGNGQWDIPELRTLLGEILPDSKTVEDFEVTHDFPEIGRRAMLLNARRLEQDAGKPGRVVLAFEDVTDRLPQGERDTVETE